MGPACFDCAVHWHNTAMIGAIDDAVSGKNAVFMQD
jgi:hypothetical protein